GDTLAIDPKLPPQWRSLSFCVCWRGRSVAIRIAGRTVQATLVEGEAMEIRIAAATRKLTAGATVAVQGQANPASRLPTFIRPWVPCGMMRAARRRIARAKAVSFPMVRAVSVLPLFADTGPRTY